MNILLVGNPNVGKTSIYNHLTQSRARVGNYPGVTVERRYAQVSWPTTDGTIDITLTDAPGTYSLVARSSEEQIVIDAVLGWGELERPDVVIAVVNATQLSRNLYLVLQLLELRVPVVIALNMVDDRGPGGPRAAQIEQTLGIVCRETNGQTGEGTKELLDQAVALALSAQVQLPKLVPKYRHELLALVDRVALALPASIPENVELRRALSIWALMSLSENDGLSHIPSALRTRVIEVSPSYLPAEGQDPTTDLDLEIIQTRYATIDRLLSGIENPEDPNVHRLVDRLDRILLHPISGGLIFLVTMLVVFQALFVGSDPAITAIESLVTWLQDLVSATLPVSLFSDLIVQGVLGGVGNVVVFLPQILLLFLFIGILEDSGYMARVAYLMDRVMKSMGLHGRAFVPLLSGFACAIPAILATRTLEHRRDQLLTMMVVPLMTCSARLPVYTLIIAALFPVNPDSWLPIQGLLLIGLYLFSVIMSLIAAWVLSKTVIVGTKMPLILELPTYRLPRLRPTWQMMQIKAAQFLKEAGTVILVATIFLWGLLTFPRPTQASNYEPPPAALSAHQEHSPSDAPPAQATVGKRDGSPTTLEQSYAGRLGKAIEPVMAPLGFDWKITTAIIGAFAAREVFVSTLGLVFGMDDLDDDATALRDKLRSEKNKDGHQKYTPLMGLSLMVFFALACQCMSTLAVVKRETRSYRWPAFLFVYMTALAYVSSLLVFQVGKLLGY